MSFKKKRELWNDNEMDSPVPPEAIEWEALESEKAVTLTEEQYHEYLGYCLTHQITPIPAHLRVWIPPRLSNYEKAQFVLENGPTVVEGACLDSYTASAVVQVFELLNERNQARLNGVSFLKCVSLVWRVWRWER